MLNKFHPSSFVLGIVSGLVVLFLLASAMRFIRPAGPGSRTPSRTHTTGQRRPSGPSQNLSSVAEQLGMTEADLRKELQSGKNLRDIAKERGIELHFPTVGPRGGSGTSLPFPAGRGGSGASMPPPDFMPPPSPQQ